MAGRFGMEVTPFLNTLKQTIFPDKGETATDSQVAAFLAVCHQYGLNPFTREIFAFPAKGGGIVPIVSVDGWLKIINEHPSFDGMDIQENRDEEDNLHSVTCTIYRKDRSHATRMTARLSEYNRDNDVWKKYKSVMLTHKAAKLCARYAFGFAGLFDEEEAREITAINVTDVSSRVVEHKTIEAKNDLKGRIAAKSETPRPSAPAQPAATAPSTVAPPQPVPSASPASSPIAFADTQGTGKAPQQASGEEPSQKFVATDDDLPADFYDTTALPVEAAEEVTQPVPEAAPEAPTSPPAEKEKRTRSAAKDPQDSPITDSEKATLLGEIKAAGITGEKIRNYLDNLTPKVTLVRNLTVRQSNAMREWIKNPSAK
jgi:phage recombination protein Bet